MTFDEFMARVYSAIIEPLLFLVFGIAVVIFIWGIVKYIKDSQDKTAQAEGKANMIWGMVGMLIMVSVFGIVNIIMGTLGIQKTQGQQDAENRLKGVIENELDVESAQGR